MTTSPSSRFPLTAARYNGLAMALHWLLGLSILALFGVGVYMADLPFTPMRLKLYNWHKWAGMSLLILSVLRLLWRLTHRPPALPHSITQRMPGWQLWAHHAVQNLMYGLFFAVPLIGWAYSSAAGYPIVLFGQLPLPDLLAPDKELAELIKPLHALSAFALLGLAGLHIAAALKHHWIDRDGLMDRMLPGRS